MIEYIKAIDGWESLTGEQIHAALSTEIVTRFRSVWDYRSLASERGIGPDATRRLIASVEAAAAQDPLTRKMDKALEATGLDASDSGTITNIEALAANEQLPLTSSDANAIKELAITRSTHWVDLGGTGEIPTAQQLVNARDIELVRQSVITITSQQHSLHVVPVLEAEDATGDDVQAAYITMHQAIATALGAE